MYYEYLIVSGLVFLWLLITWDAFSQLSGGRIRRIESDNHALAEYLEKLKNREQDYNMMFQLLIFALLSFNAVLLFINFRDSLQNYQPLTLAALAAGTIFVITIIYSILIRMLVWKVDIPVIRISFPIIDVIRFTTLWPVLLVLRLINRGVEELEHHEEHQEKATVEDEIMSLVEDDGDEGEEGELEEGEKRMIRGIFDLDDTLVREIMTPRVDMHTLPITASVTEARKEFIATGHSRIPVYGENIDEIKGVIYAKDFLDDACHGKTLEELAHTPIFIPETKNVGDLLEEFKINRIHFAIIIDEYGGTSGVVSLEDILEEIVGEICDEYDSEQDSEPEPQFQDDGSVIIDARTMLDDVETLLDLKLPEVEDVDTIAGYVCAELGKIPEAGETTVIDNKLEITVLEADKRKIITLQLKPLENDAKKSAK